MSDGKIIVVDDNAAVLKTVRRVLAIEFGNGNITTISTPALLPALLVTGKIDVVLLDMNFSKGYESGKEGLFWLNKILSYPAYPSVVVMTAFADVDLVVSAFKSGAVDFVGKPWDNDKLIATVKQAVESKRTRDLKPETDVSSPNETASQSYYTLEEMEKQLITSVLKKYERNMATCAEILKVSRQTLYNKVKKYKL